MLIFDGLLISRKTRINWVFFPWNINDDFLVCIILFWLLEQSFLICYKILIFLLLFHLTSTVDVNVKQNLEIWIYKKNSYEVEKRGTPNWLMSISQQMNATVLTENSCFLYVLWTFLCSVAICRHESGRFRSFLPFLSYFFVIPLLMK